MIRSTLIIALISLTGCSVFHQNQPVAERQYAPAAASALAFDSPVYVGYELAGLDRSAREPGAFIGYQETVTEIFSSGVIDHQTDDPRFDWYDRWTYTEKVGTRTR